MHNVRQTIKKDLGESDRSSGNTLMLAQKIKSLMFNVTFSFVVQMFLNAC